MSTALATIPPHEGFTAEQVKIIKSQIAPPGTTDDELKLFLLYCQRTGLDPFARQIYLSERRSKDRNGNWVVTRKPETTIDGFRLTAERTGHYAGQLGPFWCGDDGEWKDVWTLRDPPVAARIGILRHDFKEPLWAVALYEEYCQRTSDGPPNVMWRRMPSNQLAKCAESLGLRRAFPRELSGLYTREEMPDERTSAREAQEEVREQRIEQLKAKNNPPAEIVEWADIDPEPQPQEAQKAPPKASPKPKATIPVSADMLKAFGEIKRMLREETGNDDLYYTVLIGAGYQKSNQIPTREEGSRVYKLLAAEHTTLKVKAETLTEIRDLQSRIGDARFAAFLRDTMKLTDEEFLTASNDKLHEIASVLREIAK